MKHYLKDKFPLVAKKNDNHFSKFEVAGVEFGGSTIPVMAGPNMVESEELILNVAENVKKIGVNSIQQRRKPIHLLVKASLIILFNFTMITIDQGKRGVL